MDLRAKVTDAVYDHPRVDDIINAVMGVVDSGSPRPRHRQGGEVSDYPHRIRVKGGTVIHAITPAHGPYSAKANITVCGRTVLADEPVTMLNKAAPVSCKACGRALGGN